MTNDQTANDHAIAKALRKLEDRAYAEAVADEQRDETFRCERFFQVQCMPFEDADHGRCRLRQPNKHAIYSPKCQQESRSELQSAYSQRNRPQNSDFKQPHEKTEVHGEPAVTHQLINEYKNCQEKCEKCRFDAKGECACHRDGRMVS